MVEEVVEEAAEVVAAHRARLWLGLRAACHHRNGANTAEDDSRNPGAGGHRTSEGRAGQ